MIEEVFLGLFILIIDRFDHCHFRPMDEEPYSIFDSPRGKLVTLAMAGAICPNRSLAEHRGGFWDVPGIWYGVHGTGIRRSHCDPVLFPSGASQ